MPPEVLLDFPEEVPEGPAFGDGVEGVLEHDPGGEGVLVEAPAPHDRVAAGGQVRGPGGLSLLGQHLRQLDRDQHDLLVQVADAEFLPDLLEDGLGLGDVSQAVGDLGFEPVQAELGEVVRELLVERAGPVEDGEGFSSGWPSQLALR